MLVALPNSVLAITTDALRDLDGDETVTKICPPKCKSKSGGRPKNISSQRRHQESVETQTYPPLPPTSPTTDATTRSPFNSHAQMGERVVKVPNNRTCIGKLIEDVGMSQPITSREIRSQSWTSSNKQGPGIHMLRSSSPTPSADTVSLLLVCDAPQAEGLVVPTSPASRCSSIQTPSPYYATSFTRVVKPTPVPTPHPTPPATAVLPSTTLNILLHNSLPQARSTPSSSKSPVSSCPSSAPKLVYYQQQNMHSEGLRDAAEAAPTSKRMSSDSSPASGPGLSSSPSASATSEPPTEYALHSRSLSSYYRSSSKSSSSHTDFNIEPEPGDVRSRSLSGVRRRNQPKNSKFTLRRQHRRISHRPNGRNSSLRQSKEKERMDREEREHLAHEKVQSETQREFGSVQKERMRLQAREGEREAGRRRQEEEVEKMKRERETERELQTTDARKPRKSPGVKDEDKENSQQQTGGGRPIGNIDESHEEIDSGEDGCTSCDDVSNGVEVVTIECDRVSLYRNVQSTQNTRHPPSNTATKLRNPSQQKPPPPDAAKLQDAVLEASWQGDMFVKVPKSSFTNLNGTSPSLLSQLMNPDPARLPHSQYRGLESSTKLGSWIRWMGKDMGLPPSHSAVALPVSAQITVGSVWDKGEVRMNAMGVDLVSPPGTSGLCRKGRPDDEEMEDDSDGEDGNTLVVSNSVVEERLRAIFGSSRGGAALPGVNEQRGESSIRPPASSLPIPTPTKHLLTQVTEHSPLGFPYNLPVAAMPSTPRTTRRNMLRTEMSENVRQNLLWWRHIHKQNVLGPRRKSSPSLPDHEPIATITPVVHLTKRVDGRRSGAADADAEREAVRRELQRVSLTRNKSWATEYHPTEWD